MKRTQKIAAHVYDGKAITQMEATGLYRMPQLPAVIFQMKKDGWEIKTDIRHTRLGDRYARYFPLKDPQGRTFDIPQD